MATFMEAGRVKYLAASGLKAPLCRLYFCRHCQKIRSSDCVSHEVDSHYCPNCLENMPSTEAKLKKNRCANCFDCPSCRHTLSTRATSVAVPNPEDPSKTNPKKVYYLACGFCRWTSRDVAIPDQPIATGGWPDKENKDAKRIAHLLEYNHQLAQREKLDKERKKYTRRRSYLQLSKDEVSVSDKYGITSVAAKRRSGIMGVGGLSLKDEDVRVEPAVAKPIQEVEGLPDDIFTAPLQLEKVTNMSQRLAAPETQPEMTANLYPIHKHLLIKRSQRCKECEHNLSKPDFNPQSIKFKIQLVAVHHIPEIRLMSEPHLVADQESQVVFTLTNPLDNPTHVTVLPNAREEDQGYSNAKMELPTCELMLPRQDDAAEFDKGADMQEFQDDPSVVVFRKANKLGFLMKVTPEVKQGDVQISFLMKYDYRNLTTVLQGDNKEPEPVWLQQCVYINLGPVNNN